MLRMLFAARQCKGATPALAVLTVLLFLLAARAPGSARAPLRDPAQDARYAAALSRAPPPSAGAYTPSHLEAQWAAHAREWAGELCARIAAERPAWQRWFDAGAGGGGGAVAGEWSTLTVPSLGAAPAAVVRLEPLAGFLRDPRPSCPGLGLTPALTRDTEDAKAHLFLDPAFYALLAAHLRATPPSGTAPPRALLFDIGSTRWEPVLDSETGFGGARWFVDAYAKLGIEFDSVFAWEARPVPARDYFGSMPLALAGKWHFYNFPVAGPRHVGGGALPGPEDPLELLRAVARPGDLVVFKIDIDTEALEESIVAQLLLDQGLGALVDDLYFEHHVRNEVMGPRGWGGGQVRDVQDSIEFFQALRRHGIRAHSWP